MSKTNATDMWGHERQQKILSNLARDGKVGTRSLAELFEVSRETIRRDLMELESLGRLQRVHGGALNIERDIPPEPAFADRMALNVEMKRAVGQKACEIIPDFSTVFIDAGTTTTIFSELLCSSKKVRILTNSLEVARLGGQATSCDTLLLGGELNNEVPATYGELTLSEINRFRADFAIIAPVALHGTHGAMDYELHEAEVARSMIHNSEVSIVLCDTDKLGAESRVTICRTDEIDHVVTNSNADPDFKLQRGVIHYAQDGSCRKNSGSGR